MNEKLSKVPVTINITEKQKAVLQQLHEDSGMGKSEIIGMMLTEYEASMKKKICP